MSRILQGLSMCALLLVAQAAFAQPRNTINGIESTPLPPPPGLVPQPSAPPPQRVPVAPPPQRAPVGLPPAPPAAAVAPMAPAVPAAPVAPGDADMTVVPPPAQKIPNPVAVFAGLDKITGRTTSFDVSLGETAQFGALQVTPRACYTRPPTEQQNTTAFVEVNEVTLKGEAKRIFTGWMFASSPGLHAVEHPIYDVWLIGCKASAPGTARTGQQ